MSTIRKILLGSFTALVALGGFALWSGSRPSVADCGKALDLPGAQTYRSKAADGNCLQGYAWQPAAGVPARGVMFLIHGIHDHPGRYAALVQALTEQGIAVLSQDLRGHGGSGGDRQRVDSAAQLAGDATLGLSEASRRYPGLPVFLYGHSMGGMVAATVAAGVGQPPKLAGVVLSSAALTLPASASGGAQAVVGILSRLAPNLGLETVDPAQVVREPAARQALQADPAILRGKIPARTVATILGGVVSLQPLMPAIQVPLLILHGGADKVTEPAGSRLLAEKAGSKDKKLVMIDPALHSLLQEPEAPAVLKEIISFVDARATPK